MITKTTMVVIFNVQNSNLLTSSLPTEEFFQVNDQNRSVTNLPVVDFHSQPRGQYIGYLPLLAKFGPHCLSAKRIF